MKTYLGSKRSPGLPFQPNGFSLGHHILRTLAICHVTPSPGAVSSPLSWGRIYAAR